MRTRSLLAIVPLVLSGCLSPLTSRLDRTNHQLDTTNQRLAVVIDELADTSQRLACLEQQIDATNQKLAQIQGTLQQMDRRLEIVAHRKRTWCRRPNARRTDADDDN